MAYWGLARCGMNSFASFGPAANPALERYRDFLKEAVRRKGNVSERERMYIEAWVDGFDADVEKPHEALARRLQKISIAFPDDIEAKALYALFSIRPDAALGTEMVLREVLAREPDHPGALHYHIHNWDGVATEQGLPSCARYGPAAPNIGHSNHMPGHNYTKLGMWHEAAISMDSATRVELRYMNERLALPFETWNFAHNRDYLCYIQEQLGMEQAARTGARSLLAAPRNPNPDNPEDKDGDATFDQGLLALVRGLVKFERWDTILEKGSIPWRETPADQTAQAWVETLAYVWSGADIGLEWRTSVDALGLVTRPFAHTPAPERRYEPAELDALGPNLWSPFEAPELDCLDSEGAVVRLEGLRGKNVLLVFYLGKECVHCMEQLRAIDSKKSELEKLDTVVLAVSSASPEMNRSAEELGSLSARLLSDKDHEIARRFTSYDDFEELELHSTILIDTKGRVHWKRTGGEPFQDVDFLLAELARMNEAEAK